MQRTMTDHLRRSLTFTFPPRRVVSLCPSLTETLFALGLHSEVVGRTSYCLHPADAVHDVPTVGGTKNVDVAAVRALAPDLVIAEKEENLRENVETLATTLPVFVVDVNDCGEALRAIHDLGALTNHGSEAAQLVGEIAARFARLPQGPVGSVAYIVWRDPYRAVGPHTYIDSLLELCGLHNVFADSNDRYPTTTLSDLRSRAPTFVLLPSEPYPFTEAHVRELAPHLPGTRIHVVDGEMFAWYGSRMLRAAEYLRRFLIRITQPGTPAPAS